MLQRRALIVAGIATAAIAVLAGPAAADPPLPGSSPPNCEQGQENAWANDPNGGQFHGGKLFACFLGEPPATDPALSFGPAPRCENGQSHAWANDPQGDPFHGGQLFACFIGEPPGVGS